MYLGLLEAHPGLDEVHRTVDQRVEDVLLVVDLAERGDEVEFVSEERPVQLTGGLNALVDTVFLDGEHRELGDLLADHVGSARVAHFAVRFVDRRIVGLLAVIGALLSALLVAVYVLSIGDLA